MAKKIGVLLSGCGVYDGAEIHEATLTLYFLDRLGADAVCLAPDINQYHVINHLTQQEVSEQRNVLIESARITRGKIQKLSSTSADTLDALIITGGFGAAKNLSDYAIHGRDCSLHPDVNRLVDHFLEAHKPIGAMCIASVIVAVAFREKGSNPLLASTKPVLTIGNDAATAADLEYFGAAHKVAQVDQIVVDEYFKIVTTPAYMLGPNISDIAKGIARLVKQVVAWV